MLSYSVQPLYLLLLHSSCSVRCDRSAPNRFLKSGAVLQIDITAGLGLLYPLMQEARKENSSYSLNLPETKSALNGSSCKSR